MWTLLIVVEILAIWFTFQNLYDYLEKASDPSISPVARRLFLIIAHLIILVVALIKVQQ